MSPKIVYLISGANRGLGYGLAATLAARPDAIVFGGARDPAAQALKDLAAKHPNFHPVKLTSGDKADNEAAIAEIQKIAGQLDVIIANAAFRDSIQMATGEWEIADGKERFRRELIVGGINVKLAYVSNKRVLWKSECFSVDVLQMDGMPSCATPLLRSPGSYHERPAGVVTLAASLVGDAPGRDLPLMHSKIQTTPAEPSTRPRGRPENRGAVTGGVAGEDDYESRSPPPSLPSSPRLPRPPSSNTYPQTSRSPLPATVAPRPHKQKHNPNHPPNPPPSIRDIRTDARYFHRTVRGLRSRAVTAVNVVRDAVGDSRDADSDSALCAGTSTAAKRKSASLRPRSTIQVLATGRPESSGHYIRVLFCIPAGQLDMSTRTRLLCEVMIPGKQYGMRNRAHGHFGVSPRSLVEPSTCAAAKFKKSPPALSTWGLDGGKWAIGSDAYSDVFYPEVSNRGTVANKEANLQLRAE
ncbi:hypothetical protein C8R44DRAFT_730497 [Mycena epipterygia]|nr:hypothetical protein C8R44DRAFT_730497 [Mycena epipterygia]